MLLFPRASAGCWIRRVEVTDSTQDHLSRLVRRSRIPPPAGTVIVAGRQTAGRGREGRTWLSPEGGLYASLLVRVAERAAPEDLAVAFGLLPLRTGLAVCDVLEAAGLRPSIKWPNDVRIEGGKAAGILCESQSACVIVGVGLNLRENPLPTAASLSGVNANLGREVALQALLEAFVHRFERDDTTEEVERRLAGRNATARHGGRIVRILGIAPDGALRIEGPDGTGEIRGGGLELEEEGPSDGLG